MAGRGESEGAQRTIVYCVVPRDLAGKLHEPLRRHFRDAPHVEIIVERRAGSRRQSDDRRSVESESAARKLERRLIRNAAGRRVADRRVSVPRLEAPELPRGARRFADRLLFVERLKPSDEHAEDHDTARLVTRIQGGDSDAFAVLYSRYFERVYAYLRLLLKDSHEAEDATQQVFLQVLTALPRYERRRQPFRAWLFVIVRNYALTSLEKLSRVEAEDPATIGRRRELIGAEPTMEAISWISDAELLMFIERLPLAQRQVLALRYLLDLPTQEIARILDRSPTDVRKLQERALGFLEKRLTALGRAPRSAEHAEWRRLVPKTTVLRARRWALLP